MKRLLHVAPFSVVPPRYGGPIRVYNLNREAAREFEVDEFAQQAQRADLRFTVRPLVKVVGEHYREYASRDPISIALFAATSLWLECPPFWQSWRLRRGAPAWLRDRVEAADLLVVEHPWQFDWVAGANRGRKPLVLVSENVEADLSRPGSIRAPRSVAARIAAAIADQERLACSRATHVIAVSDSDAARLRELYGLAPEKLSVVPNGVDCERFRPVTDSERSERKRELGLGEGPVVVFTGSGHPPNVAAARRVLEWAEGWPDPAVQFLVAGSVGRSLPRSGRARVTGSVPDTLPYLQAADVALNHVTEGGGTNLKQLEYMAMGLPVAATPVGARGTGAQSGLDVLVGEVSEIPDLLSELLADGPLRSRVGAAARRLVEDRFAWPILGDRYRAILRRLVSG